MKSTLEVLSIFFISILFLFSTGNKKEIKDKKVDISTEIKQNLSKNIDYKATPMIIVKRD